MYMYNRKIWGSQKYTTQHKHRLEFCYKYNVYRKVQEQNKVMCLQWLDPLVHAHNLPISRSDVDDVLGSIDAESNEGDNPTTSSDPEDQATNQPRQSTTPVLQDCLDLCTRVHRGDQHKRV